MKHQLPTQQTKFSRPVVAIPIPRDYFEREPLWGNAGGYRAVNEIVRAVEEAGGEPRLLFPGEEELEYDGLVLPGGGDIDPSFYGQDAHSQVLDTDAGLDNFQLQLAKKALLSGTPVLGICRGMQVLNVAAGGTLVQHLESTQAHFPAEARENADLRPLPVHQIDLVEDSHLARLLGELKVAVNSLHHQAADFVPEGLRVVATSDDGTIEAIEGPGAYQLGVQFHPEDLRHTDYRFQSLFSDLVQAAAS